MKKKDQGFGTREAIDWLSNRVRRIGLGLRSFGRGLGVRNLATGSGLLFCGSFNIKIQVFKIGAYGYGFREGIGRLMLVPKPVLEPEPEPVLCVPAPFLFVPHFGHPFRL